MRPLSLDQEQEIAEFVGYRQITWTWGQHTYKHWIAPGEIKPDVNSEFFRQRIRLPAYLDNLNAIKKAVDSQPEEFQSRFDDELHEMARIKRCYIHQLNSRNWCAAFLLAANKWKELK